MKNLKYFFFVFVLLISVSFHSQSQNGLLWKISGNKLVKPSYIFGTIHLICDEDYVMTPEIEAALGNTEAYFAELDLSDMNEIMKLQASLTSNVPLKQAIGVNNYNKIGKLLQENFKMDIKSFDKQSLASIMSSVSLKSFNCKNYKMYEMELMSKAMKNKMKMGGLESVEYQINVMNNSFTPESIIAMLEDYKINGNKETENLVNLYKSQNIEALFEEMKKSSYTSDESLNVLLRDRNYNWIKVMPEIMQKHPTFFAVGAGHLGGNDGVISLLKKKGYTIEAVKID